MKRHLKIVLMVTVVIMAALPVNVTAQEDGGPSRVGFRPDAPEYALHGPYWIGTTEVVIHPDSERPLPTTIWYPALNPEGLPEEVIYDQGVADLIPAELEHFQMNDMPGRALRDATPNTEDGPYPLVVWSHGHGGTRFYGSHLMEHLASVGFVVIAPCHTGNASRTTWTSTDLLMEQTAASAILRSQDIAATIDFAEELNADGMLAGIIDLERVGVIGYSFGGITALKAGGAQIDMNFYRDYCDRHPEHRGGCDIILAHEQEMATLAGLAAIPDGLWPPQSDPRLDVIVPLLPSVDFIGPEGVKSVSVPTFMIAAGADSQAAPEDEVRPVYESLLVNKALVVFTGGEHGVWGGGISGPLADFPPYQIFAYDPVWDLDRGADLARHFVTAFLLAHLYDDTEAAAALAPDAVQFPGIVYETTGF